MEEIVLVSFMDIDIDDLMMYLLLSGGDDPIQTNT